MDSIIKEIYFRNRGNDESIQSSEEYIKAEQKYFDIHEELIKEIPENLKEKIENMFWASADMEAEATLTHFIEGFKLGLLVAFEAHN